VVAERASVAPRGVTEFELSVPICEQSDDSIRLSLGHRDELQSAIALQRISRARWGRWERPGLPFYWIAAATSLAMSFIAHEGEGLLRMLLTV
jgi:hypothetical protein